MTNRSCKCHTTANRKRHERPIGLPYLAWPDLTTVDCAGRFQRSFVMSRATFNHAYAAETRRRLQEKKGSGISIKRPLIACTWPLHARLSTYSSDDHISGVLRHSPNPIHGTGGIMFSGCPSVCACVHASLRPNGGIPDRLAVDF